MAFSRPSLAATICMSPCGWPHPPPSVPPFLVMQNPCASAQCDVTNKVKTTILFCCVGLFIKMNVDILLQIAIINQPLVQLSWNYTSYLSSSIMVYMIVACLLLLLHCKVCLWGILRLSVKQSKMQSHLIDCLNKGIMSPFPKKHCNKVCLPHPTCIWFSRLKSTVTAKCQNNMM